MLAAAVSQLRNYRAQLGGLLAKPVAVTELAVLDEAQLRADTIPAPPLTRYAPTSPDVELKSPRGQ